MKAFLNRDADRLTRLAVQFYVVPRAAIVAIPVAVIGVATLLVVFAFLLTFVRQAVA